MIHRQHMHGRSTRRGDSDDLLAMELKVPIPLIEARIEQWGVRTRHRIEADQIRALVAIAERAREREIVEGCRTDCEAMMWSIHKRSFEATWGVRQYSHRSCALTRTA